MRKIVCAFVLLFAAAGLQAQSAKYIEALKNYQQGETAEALRLFQEELQENPSNDAACYYIAAIYSGNPGKAAEAERWIKRAIELSPDNFWYRYDLALLYLRTDRQELAVPMLEQLTADFPKKTDLYFDLINVYSRSPIISPVKASTSRIRSISSPKNSTRSARSSREAGKISTTSPCTRKRPR